MPRGVMSRAFQSSRRLAHPVDEGHGAAPAAEVPVELLGQGQGHLLDVLAGHVQADFLGDAAQLGFVADGVIAGRAFADGE